MNDAILRAVRYLVLCLLIVLAIALNGARVFLLSAEDCKADLQNRLRELTELPIEIGRLHAHMHGFSPELILDNIKILAEQGQAPTAVTIVQIRLRLSVLPLLFTQQLLPSSQLTLVGVQLSLVRNKKGRVSVVGLAAKENSKLPSWLVEGGHYKVIDSHITWVDKQRSIAPITFQQLNFSFAKAIFRDHYTLHLLTQLPEQYGESLRVSMLIQGDITDTDTLTGVVYSQATGLQIATLITTEMPLGLKEMSGEIDFKQWAYFENTHLSSLTTNVQAKNLLFGKQKQDGGRKLLQINALNTAFSIVNEQGGWTVNVVDLSIKKRDEAWPTARFSLALDDTWNQLSASIQQFDLAELATLVQFFAPLNIEQQHLLAQLQPQGMLKNVALYIDNTQAHYAVNGWFNHIDIHAFDGLPQIKNLTASIQGDNKKGKIVFATNQGQLFFPNLFRQAFTIDQLVGELTWLQTPDKWQLTAKHLRVNNKDFQTESNLFVTIPKKEDPIFMDLQLAFANIENISHIRKYYPVSIMDKTIVHWLDNAFVSGKISQGKVLVYGELDDFPFVDNKGVFEVLYQMEGVEFQYDEDWPHLQQLSAQVLLLKNGITINLTHAEVNDLVVKQAILEIPSFATSDYLSVQGTIEGDIIDGLEFLQKTPLRKTTNHILDVITPAGLSRVDLALSIPLVDSADASSHIVVNLAQASLTVNAIALDVTAMTGELLLTEKGFFTKGIKAETLGFPIQIKANSDSLSTKITVDGQTDMGHLKKQFDFFNNWILKDPHLQGAMAYQMTLDLPIPEDLSARLSIHSDLAGLTVNFPGELAKTAAEKSSLIVSMALNEQDILPLSLQYQDDLMIAMSIQKQKNEVVSAHIVYRENQDIIASNQTIIPIDKGIKLQIERDVFNLAEWAWLFTQNQTTNGQSGLAVNEISLITKQLRWNDKAYGAFDLALHRSDGQWQGNIASTMAKGAFTIPINATENAHIKLDMAHLSLTELMQIDFQGENITAATLPLIDILSEKLWWEKVNLGNLQMETQQLPNGIRFKRLDILSPQHKIKLQADWIKNKQETITNMYGHIDTTDFGEFLTQFGFDNDFKESQGKIELNVTWPGLPYQFSIDTMKATTDIELQGGRLTSVEPGFGRILGLLAVEQWIKRITLDFSDLYQQGMSLNHISGHFETDKGKAVTNNLLIDAVPAQISITGEADLIAKTVNHTVEVVPKISNALPVAGAIISGVAGTITQVLVDDYEKGYFFGSKYTVEGPWDEITITPAHE